MTTRKKTYGFKTKIATLLLSLLLTSISVIADSNTPQDPSTSEKILLKDFEVFDIKYAQRNTSYKLDGDAWSAFAKLFATHQATLVLGKNYYLRANLIKGECYLFASQEYYNEDRKKFLENYKKGIEALEEIVLEVHNSDTPETDDYLPPFSKMVRGLKLNTYAGFESIGTGFEKGFSDRNVSYSNEKHANIEQFIAYLKGYVSMVINRGGNPKYSSDLNQISTSNTAREFLSEFCPWGVSMFSLLEQSGFTAQLDYKILRPFAQGLDKAFHSRVPERLLNNLQWYYSNEGQPYDLLETPPLLCDLNISPAKVPQNVKSEMNEFVGIHDDKEEFRFHEGTFGKLPGKEIKWLTVGDPTYNLWFVSPMIYTEWTASDYINSLFYLMTWYNGGMIWGAASVVSDIAVSSVLNEFLDYMNTSMPTPCVTNFTMYAGLDQFRNSQLPLGGKSSREILSTTAREGKWVDPKGMSTTIFKWIFGQFDEMNRKTFFNGIDPSKIEVGKTYNGDKIPPIIFVSNVSGILEVPDEEYPKTINIYRYYLMSPKHETYTVDYDLEKSNFLLKNEGNIPISQLQLQGVSDKKMKAFDVVTSFAPNAQFLEFKLDPETTKLITDNDEVELVLRATNMDIETMASGIALKYATATIKPHDESFRFELYNELTQKEAYENQFISNNWVGRRNLVRQQNKELAQSAKGEYHISLVPIKAQYELEIKINGKYFIKNEEDKYRINLYNGPRGGGRDPITGVQSRGRIPITGELSEVPLNPNYVELKYDRKIELPIAEVAKGKVNE